MTVKKITSFVALCSFIMPMLSGCADGVGPAVREAKVPSPVSATERQRAINENGEPVLYVPLGQDVLMPTTSPSEPLPSTIVGPFELRDESLSGALQLLLDGTDIPVAFESGSNSSQTITVTNLKGPLEVVVQEVCSLANMYCSYQNGILVVKDEQVFTVTIPPIAAATEIGGLMTNISTALGSITGQTPVTDPSTRTIVYRATQRTAELAQRYFQRLRTNTALVVFETYIWEVSLDAGNTTGIRWSAFDQIGKFRFGVNVAGAADTNVGSPISIGLPTASAGLNFNVDDVFQFISSYGAVKTISQPQVTMLAGSSATLRVSDAENYVASISRSTTDGGTTTVSTTTDTANSGFTLTIGSNWDNATVYSSINILLEEVRDIETFDDNEDAVVQLPKTTERELTTQVRVRPGDTLLIAGLVREFDSLDRSGPGIKTPIIPTSRSAKTDNSELVFLLKPRVIVFTTADSNTPRKGIAPNIQPMASILPDPSPAAVPALPLESNVTTSDYTPAVAPVAESVVSDDMSNDVNSAAPTPMPASAPAPEPVSVVAPAPTVAPTAPAIEVQPLHEAVPESYKQQTSTQQSPATDTPAEGPSVIVNYDVLGR